jgi:hypothetical protein
MLYSIQRLCEERLAVVLVDRRELAEPRATSLIRQLQVTLTLPVMLVARDNEIWTGARARADFDSKPHLYALLSLRDIDWGPLPTTCYDALEA